MMGENSTHSYLIMLIFTSSSFTSFHASGIPALTGSDVHLRSRTLSLRRSTWHRLKRSVGKSWLGLEFMLVGNTGLCLQEVRARESCCSFESIGEDAALLCITTCEAER